MRSFPSSLLISVTCLLSLGLFSACTKEPETFTGEIEANEVDVGVKIPGRIATIDVVEGQFVKKGDVLGHLESPEVEGKMQTVKAAIREAEEQLIFATKSYERLDNLYKTNVIPKQQFDEATYKFEAAKQKVKAIQGQLAEVQAAFDEMTIKAPIDGEVVELVSHAGELVSPGYPTVTILNIHDQWATFNIREDKLVSIQKGNKVSFFVPALGKSLEGEVSYISALGTFAKWKATNEQGHFDLKTFEVRVRPSIEIINLRPGMTATAIFKDKV